MNTLKKTATRSTKRTGSPTKNMSGLPYGTGSIQKRGRVYWMIYRNVNGDVVAANTGTDNRADAQRILAQQALVTLRARMHALVAIIESGNEATSQASAEAADQSGHEARHGDEPGSRRRSVRDDAPERRDRAAKATAKGGRR
jgi:hypothetical protein